LRKRSRSEGGVGRGEGESVLASFPNSKMRGEPGTFYCMNNIMVDLCAGNLEFCTRK